MRLSIGLLPLLLALVIGASLRIELVRVAPPFLVGNDSSDYFSAGYNLLVSGELHLSLKRTPLYSLFLAGTIQTVGPSLDRLLTVQHALGMATIGVFGFLSSEIVRRTGELVMPGLAFRIQERN